MGQFDCVTHILRVVHGRDARATRALARVLLTLRLSQPLHASPQDGAFIRFGIDSEEMRSQPRQPI